MMRMEGEERFENANAEFRMQVFANDPGLYHELFEKDPREEIEVEDIAPQSPEELERLLNQMRREGFIE